MDDIPYDFILRVITKLDNPDLPIIRESPLWAEARRVYHTKCQDLRINLFLTPTGPCYSIKSTNNDRLTFAAAVAMDHRFTRITDFTVYAVRENSGNPELKVDNLSEFIRFISCFIVNYADFKRCSGARAARDVVDECLRNGLQTKNLFLAHLPGAEELLSNQLKLDGLQELRLYGDWPSDLKDDLETFVCRPNFRYLECAFGCLDMDNMKRILDYWNSMEHPWGWSRIKLRTNGSLKEQFASWLLHSSSCHDFDTFEWSSKNLSLTVTCNTNVSTMFFYLSP